MYGWTCERTDVEASFLMRTFDCRGSTNLNIRWHWTERDKFIKKNILFKIICMETWVRIIKHKRIKIKWNVVRSRRFKQLFDDVLHWMVYLSDTWNFLRLMDPFHAVTSHYSVSVAVTSSDWLWDSVLSLRTMSSSAWDLRRPGWAWIVEQILSGMPATPVTAEVMCNFNLEKNFFKPLKTWYSKCVNLPTSVLRETVSLQSRKQRKSLRICSLAPDISASRLI